MAGALSILLINLLVITRVLKMCDNIDSENISCTPPELREIANKTLGNLLPKKSHDIYNKEYQRFETWSKENNVKIISENILLAYFEIQSKNKKSSTLWSLYSMLRSCLNIYKNVDISQYAKLQAFLKRSSEGYVAKKSKILEAQNIETFIQVADDKMYLAMKIILIMGYNGACRREELTNMSTDDIDYKSDMIMVTVPKTKNYLPRIFTITQESWIILIKKYSDLRPKYATHKRFFVTYRNGYCTSNPIGINTIGKIPKLIANYLKLPNPELFTGHCFRRSSASHLANSGGDLITLKRHGGWKSSAVAEGYIDTSMKKKIEVGQILSTCNETVTQMNCNMHKNTVHNNENIQRNIVSDSLPAISINAGDSCNITVNVYKN